MVAQLVESATTAIRYDERLKKKYENLSARIGKMKAKVAIARIMTEIVWHMLTNETEYRTKNEDLIKRKISVYGCILLRKNLQGRGAAAP